ncbi:MAG: riboflavin synthase [Cellvibrionaceae bacterium]|jgi:riboflavin synthase
MFTGIVEEIGTVTRLSRGGKGYDLAIQAKVVLRDSKLGDSICVNGVCLTVTQFWDGGFTVGVSPETREVTNLMGLRAGSRVNLERSATPTSRLGGHFVQGHVDAVGTITEFRPDEDALWVTVGFPANMMRYIVQKGYITLDGTSLTVVDVYESSFTVQLVAYTQTEIILPLKKVGDQVNVEVDVLGKYVEKMLGHYQPQSSSQKSGITADFLAKNGYG